MNKTNNVSEEKVQTIFDSIADNYDTVNSIISAGMHKKWRALGTRRVNNATNILDLCCGTGDWTIDLAKNTDVTAKITAVDFSANMLKIAEKKFKNNRVDKKIKIIQADAMNLPFDDNTFDVVTIGFGLRNVPDANQTLSEIYRVLKPGGRIICLEAFKIETPVIKQGWQIYFGKIMPQIGAIFNHKKEEYNYLNSSVNHFVSPEKLKEMMKKIRFKKVTINKFMFGAAALHIGEK